MTPMLSEICPCTVQTDVAWFECERLAGHEGDHVATYDWTDAECDNAQHSTWSEEAGRTIHDVE